MYRGGVLYRGGGVLIEVGCSAEVFRIEEGCSVLRGGVLIEGVYSTEVFCTEGGVFYIEGGVFYKINPHFMPQIREHHSRCYKDATYRPE